MRESGHVNADLALARYRLGPMIGRGGTASVRGAVDVRSGRRVAVKTIPDDPTLTARVGREVRAAQRLDHPCIVRILDWGNDPGCVRLVWELIEGPSLKALIGEGALDDRAALQIMADVLDALDHAHGRGVVHRDVKPANVLVDGDGRARLTDFGVARLHGDTPLTVTGDLVGTVAYMSPEQAQGRPVGPASDVYSACLVAYEMLAGSNPNRGSSPAAVMQRAAAGRVPDLGDVRPDLHPDLTDAVMAGLHPDPTMRPAAARLRAALTHVAPVASPRRLPSTWRMRALAAAAMAVGVAVALRQWGGLDDTTTLAAAVGVGLVWAVLPTACMLGMVAAALWWLSQDSPGLATLGVLPGVALVVATRRVPHVALAAVMGPLATATGLAPLAAALVGRSARVSHRIALALAGLLTTVAWQLAMPGHGLLLGSGPPVGAQIRDEAVTGAAHTVGGILADAPWAGVQAIVIVVAAVAARLFTRPGDGVTRATIAAAWCLVTAAGLTIAAPDPMATAAACVPALLLVLIGVIQPWRHLGRLGESSRSATLPGPL